MIQNITDPTCFLYHYTSMETASDHIVKTGRLRMGSFRTANDPKESKNWWFNFGSNENRNLAPYNRDILSRQMSDTIKDRANVICFCLDTPPLTGNHLDDILRRGFAKPRMWAQYGHKHAGVCLVFDRLKLEVRMKAACAGAFVHWGGKVTYRNRFLVDGHEGDYMINIDELEKRGFDRYWRAHIATFRHRLFFEKLEDWRDECEFRYVAVFDKPTEVYIDYGDALVGVMFGDGVDEIAEDALIELLLPTKTHLMGLKWSNCSPWYDFGAFKYDRQLRKSPWNRPKPTL